MLTKRESVGNSILKAYAQKNEKFVVIIDEYDVLVRENVSEKLFSEYLGFLNGLFKSDTLRPAISLAYITGILPVIRDRVQSKLNNFREYTILDAGKLAEFIGFTSGEVQELCEKYNVDFSEMKRWYDGYKEKKYFDSLAQYSGNLLFVGINYDENKKTHTCKIEQFIKE